MNNRRKSIQKLVLAALLTALVIVLQLMGAFIRFGVFSVTLVLIPIVIGAATCGVAISTWLGLVFGAAVLLSGDAAPFLAISVPGTIITVLAKGMLCGLLAGLAFKLTNVLLEKRSAKKLQLLKKDGLCESCETVVFKFISHNNKYLAVLVAALVCPLANTGVFLVGCRVFFWDMLSATATNLGINLINYIVFVLIGGNFLFEIATNIILSPIVVRLLNVRNRAS